MTFELEGNVTSPLVGTSPPSQVASACHESKPASFWGQFDLNVSAKSGGTGGLGIVTISDEVACVTKGPVPYSMGRGVGDVDGLPDGEEDGPLKGELVGGIDGLREGEADGFLLGDSVGFLCVLIEMCAKQGAAYSEE